MPAATIAMTPAPWRSLDELRALKMPLGSATHVVVRTGKDDDTSYRFLPYKKGAQPPYVGGRWQVVTEYSWSNADLPPQGEWQFYREWQQEHKEAQHAAA